MKNMACLNIKKKLVQNLEITNIFHIFALQDREKNFIFNLNKFNKDVYN